VSLAVAPGRAAETADEARAAVRARVEAAGTSFYWAMRVLPQARRDAMFAIYAFCREVDDIADGTESPEAKRRELDAWRREIAALFTDRPATTAGRALIEPTRAFGLRREDFLAVIDGMEMDAGGIRAPDLAELDLYCDRVAHSLGRALQLTNILRDLAEDGARGRLYLPRELLQAAGIAATDPAAVLKHPALARVCTGLAEMAERHFAEARAAMRECPRRPMRPAAAMGAVYHAILVRLRRRGWLDLGREVKIPAPLKLWFALRYGLL
jgi:phytoene synthase